MSRGPIGLIKAHWQVIVLSVGAIAVLVVLLSAGGMFADDRPVENEGVTDDQTNTQNGLGVEDGTRISAPPTGMTAENIAIEPDERDSVENTLTTELDVDSGNVHITFDEDANAVHAEVFTKDVTAREFANALNEAGVEYDESDIRSGVTQQTRDDIIRTIELQLDEADLSGGNVTQEATASGEYYIVTEVPDTDPDEHRALLQGRGVVEVVAYHPGGEDGEQINTTVLEQDDIDEVDSASFDERRGQHYVPITLSTAETNGQSPAERYQSDMVRLGFTDDGVGQCSLYDRETGAFNYDHEDQQWCLVTEVDGEPVDAHSMGGDLARSMEEGVFTNDPTFRMIVPTQQDAVRLSVNLNAGALRAPLDFDREQTASVSVPSE